MFVIFSVIYFFASYESIEGPDVASVEAIKFKLNRSLENFREHCGRYPTVSEGINQLIEGHQDTVPCFRKVPNAKKLKLTDLVDEKHIKSIQSYTYHSSHDGQLYKVEFEYNNIKAVHEGGEK